MPKRYFRASSDPRHVLLTELDRKKKIISKLAWKTYIWKRQLLSSQQFMCSTYFVIQIRRSVVKTLVIIPV